MSTHRITAEERIFSVLTGWQAEEKFRAHREGHVRRQALALQAGTGPGVHLEARSLPSGPAASPRAWALLTVSAFGLGIAIAGYLGIAVTRAGWEFFARGHK